MREEFAPTPDDRFTFGLWTVGNPGRDPFGHETRPPLDPNESVERLAALGAYGVNFHDDDLVPPGSSASEREAIVKQFRRTLDATGMRVPMATTNLFSNAVFKDGAYTANDPAVRRYALAKTLDAIDLGVELGATVYVMWGGREGSESDAAKDVRLALDRYKEAVDLCCAYAARSALRPAIRPRTEAERAPRQHPAAHRRSRARVRRPARVAGDGRAESRVRARDDVGLVVPSRDRADALGGEALPHRPERSGSRQVRPGLPLRFGRRTRRVLHGEAARGCELGRHRVTSTPIPIARRPPRASGSSPRAACAAT